MMRTGSIFNQLLTLFPRNEFQRAVAAHGAERNTKGFASWDQFVAMLFCQIAQANSLREICGGLATCLGKLRHLGLAQAPKRSTLAYANSHRPWELYETVFGQLLAKCQSEVVGRRKFRFHNKLYSLDSSIIDLSLSLFDWSRYIQTKGAVKLHLILDHDGYLPVFAHITDARVHDVEVAKTLDFPADSVLAIDRGYLDYQLYSLWTERKVWFVTRARRNMKWGVVETRAVAEGTGVVRDDVIEITSRYGSERCKVPLRRIEFIDADTGKEFVFLTNHMHFAASTITKIYKDRWQIESFFKTLKQNLRIKTFVGTSPNAVRTQIWTALIAILLLRYLQLRARRGWSLSNLVALLRWNLFTYRDLWKWLDDPFDTPAMPPGLTQLSLGLQ